MERPGPGLIGRTTELGELEVGLQAACQGAGQLYFLVGESGIGKSHLCEWLAEQAAARQMAVHWGRCWEAGGAPAFWPVIQVLRSQLRAVGTEGPPLLELDSYRRNLLAQLLPELRVPDQPVKVGAGSSPEEARFQLLDALGAWLAQAAAGRPQVLILEDLHAADPSSIQLLDFISSAVRSLPILLLGTYREGAALRSEVGSLLSAVTGRARKLPLGRLSPAEVEQIVANSLEAAASASLIDAVYASTEGHPLFVVETVRLLAVHAGRSAEALVPSTVRLAIVQRLERLEPSTRAWLEIASVFGREWELDALSAVSQVQSLQLSQGLTQALDTDILLLVHPGHYRFAHILFQEVLYQGIALARREVLHAQVAAWLQEHQGDASRIAHHFLAAGVTQREAALNALVLAAADAATHLAFREAAALYKELLQRASAGLSLHDRLLYQLEFGRNRCLAGELAEGREACLQVVQEAREGEPELLAEAALAYGAVFVFASVNDRLVQLLTEALQVLPAGDSPLRARVMARLAAAQQPSENPSEPIALALSAIAMARRVGTAQDLLETLRSACSALVDMAPPEQREPLNREHVALAEQLDDVGEVLRGRLRLCFDLFEEGDVGAACAVLAASEAPARQLNHPHYQWRMQALAAAQAAFEGRFADAAAHREQATRLAQSAGDPNAELGLCLQRLDHARLLGEHQEALQWAERARQLAQGAAFMERYVTMLQLAQRARSGPVTAGPLTRAVLHMALTLGDRTIGDSITELALQLGDQALLEQTRALLLPSAHCLIHGGMLAVTWGAPCSYYLARVCAALGRNSEARTYFGRALSTCKKLGARGHFVWVSLEYGLFLQASDELPQARELWSEACRVARDLGMTRVEENLVGLLQVESPPAASEPQLGSPALTFSVEPDGDSWRFRVGEVSFTVRETKGMRMLVRLLQEPGCSVHVLDLAVPGGALDTGDAGEVGDRTAREAYRDRMRQLREELQEAEDHHDLGRVTRCQEELEQLSNELASQLGLGGRARRVGSAAERARVNVQRRLKDAIGRISTHHPQLGKHLQLAVRTGMFCVYQVET